VLCWLLSNSIKVICLEIGIHTINIVNNLKYTYQSQMAHLPTRIYTLPEILSILTTIPSPNISSAPSSTPSSVPSPTSSPTTPPKKRRYCTWCGLPGHRKATCTDLTAAFKLGVIRTRRGKICLVDGGKIPWPHGERCLKDWVLKNARSGEVETWRRETASVRSK
jgi:hypothetical protein